MTLEFRETPLAGAFVIVPITHNDDRGSFGRLFDEALFRERGLDPRPPKPGFT